MFLSTQKKGIYSYLLFSIESHEKIIFSNLTIIIKYLNASDWNTYLKVLDQFWNMTSLCSIFFYNECSRLFL